MIHIPLCGRNRGMPQELRHGDHIATTSEGPEGEGVVERVRTDELGVNVGRDGTLGQDIAGRPRGGTEC